MHSVNGVVGQFNSTRKNNRTNMIDLDREECNFFQFQTDACFVKKAGKKAGRVDVFMPYSPKMIYRQGGQRHITT